jgi:ribose transport system substrate-binding protein
MGTRQATGTRWRGVAASASAALLLSAALAPTASAQDEEPLKIAYLSFAVANTYDEPMLAAAEEAAAAGNATLTVFDANNDPGLQTTQLQDAVTSGEFDGILVQPIYGAGLVLPVQDAIAAGVPVGNVDQILGEDMTTSDAQVEGLSANVVFVPSEIGRKMGELTVQACADAAADPCEVGYIDAFGQIPLDISIRAAFDEAIAVNPSISVVAQGIGMFNPASGLTAGQDMLQAQPGIDVIVGSDQAITGVLQAIEAAAPEGPIATIGYGGGALAVQDVAAGTRYATVMQMPATEGKLAIEHLIAAIRSGEPVAGVDPVSELPDEGIVRADNASQFTPEWPG